MVEQKNPAESNNDVIIAWGVCGALFIVVIVGIVAIIVVWRKKRKTNSTRGSQRSIYDRYAPNLASQRMERQFFLAQVDAKNKEIQADLKKEQEERRLYFQRKLARSLRTTTTTASHAAATKKQKSTNSFRASSMDLSEDQRQGALNSTSKSNTRDDEKSSPADEHQDADGDEADEDE